MQLKPFRGSVVIEPEADQRTSKSGLSYEHQSDSNGIGTIVAVDPLSKKFTAEDVGKRVLFVKYQHTKVVLDGKDWYIPKAVDVLGYIED